MVLLSAGAAMEAANASTRTVRQEEEKYRAAEGRAMNTCRREAKCRMKRASSRNGILGCVDSGCASALQPTPHLFPPEASSLLGAPAPHPLNPLLEP